MSVDPTPPLPLSSEHVALQFARRGDLAAAQFLYGEVATRMMGRLNYIRATPQVLVDAGCGAGANYALLHEKYPQAAYTGLDQATTLLEMARKQHAPRTLRSLVGKVTGRATQAPRFIQGDLAATGLAPESVDLVWSNMALHWHPRPHDVLGEWRRILKTGALTMFSCLGPTTLIELRNALASAGLKTQTPTFVDMHDFGDLLIERGFSDPVMDQEVLTLTYRTPQKLLEDVRALGGNPALERKPGLASRQWRDRLLEALEAQRGEDGLIRLSIEVAYGHAWRAGSRRSSATETRLSVDAIGGRR